MRTRKFADKNPGYRTGQSCFYIDITDLAADLRFDQHMHGIKDNAFVRMHGVALRPDFTTDIHLSPFEIAVEHESRIARSLRAEGCGVWAPVLDAPETSSVYVVHLNDIPGLENPTSELIGSWIWNRLKPTLPELSWVTVYETATCGAHFDGERYRIWKDLRLDSSLQLKRAPEGNRRRRVHGHTYTLRLHLNAPIDSVMGWTLDFGDVKELFNPIFHELDHQPLHEIAELEDNDCASLAHWIKRKAAPLLPQLDRIDVLETRGCGAILAWGEDEPALPV